MDEAAMVEDHETNVLEDSNFLSGRDLLKSGRYEEAIVAFTCALEVHRLGVVFMGRGRVWQLLGQHAKAVEDYTEALKLSSDDNNARRCRLYVLRAASYAPLTRGDLALRDYASASHLNPNDSSIYSGRASLYMSMQQLDVALQNCHMALQRDSGNVLAYQHMGMVYIQMKQIKDAISAFDRAIAIRPHYETLVMRGKAHASLDDRRKALDDFTGAIMMEPKLSLAYGNRATMYAHSNQLSLAVSDATQCILNSEEGGKDLISSYQARGVWQAQMGEYVKAVEDFTTVINLDPRHIVAYSSRATAYSHMKQHDMSITDWLAVARLHANWPKSYWSIGDEYCSKKDFNSAIRFYSKSIQLDEKIPSVFRKRAAAYAELGIAHKAMFDLSMAIGMMSRNAELYAERGYAYLQLGDEAKAISDYNTAIHLDVKNPIYYEMRAAAFWKMGNARFGRTDMLQAKRMRRDQEKLAEAKAAQQLAEAESIATAEAKKLAEEEGSQPGEQSKEGDDTEGQETAKAETVEMEVDEAEVTED